MQMKLVDRGELVIRGRCVETSLETFEGDLDRLWTDFRNEKRPDTRQYTLDFDEGVYGLMWYTENHRYCYLLGREINGDAEEGSMPVKVVPPARYAVLRVPENMPVVEAWTVFFERILPEAGYAPDPAHGLYFEYYRNEHTEACELWTPVVALKL